MARLLVDDFLDWVRPFTARCATCGHGNDDPHGHSWVFCVNDACKRVCVLHDPERP